VTVSSDTLIMLIIIIAIVLFIAGRWFQRMRDAQKALATTLASIPGRRAAARKSIWFMVKLGAVVLLLGALAVNAVQYYS
jgi:hypothetical protein